MSEITVKPILQSDEINIDLCYYEDMPFIAYFKIETDKLFYSQDLISVNIRSTGKSNSNNLNDIQFDKAVDFLLEDHKRYVERYEKGVKLNDPLMCTTYHRKTDLIEQAKKMVLNGVFSETELYEYLIYVYSYVESGFEYLYILMKALWFNVKGEIYQKVREDLKKYQNITTDKVIIYRGFNKYSREDGLSFTFDYDTAKFFANRWGEGEGYINKYEVNVSDIFAYIHHEQEVVTDKAVFLEKVN